MIANMAPECGATMIYFPVDQNTLDYLRLTGKSDEHVRLVEKYFKKQHLFRLSNSPDPLYTHIFDLNLDEIEPSMAGPKRPQDRVHTRSGEIQFSFDLIDSRSAGGIGLRAEQIRKHRL